MPSEAEGGRYTECIFPFSVSQKRMFLTPTDKLQPDATMYGRQTGRTPVFSESGTCPRTGGSPSSLLCNALANL